MPLPATTAAPAIFAHSIKVSGVHICSENQGAPLYSVQPIPLLIRAHKKKAVVLLSVGGKLFTTTQATLTSPLAHGSMLETLVDLHTQRLQDASPARDMSSTEADAPCVMQPTLRDARHPDALFIDRDGGNFGYILSYLRCVLV